MLKARFLAVGLALCLVLLTTGCGKEPEAMVLTAYDELLAATHQVQEGQTLTLAVPLPSETATVVEPTCTEGITAVYTAPDLVVTGVTPGAQTVTLTFSDKGFADGVVVLPITVTEIPPPPLHIALVSGQLGLNTPVSGSTPLDFTFYQGQMAQVEVVYRLTGVKVSVEADPAYLDYQLSGDTFTLTALQPGTTTLTITASTQGLADAQAVCTVEIKAPSDHMAEGLPDIPQKPHTDAQYQPLAEEIFAAALAQREAAGLPAYTYNNTMDTAAFIRAKEAAESWSHTRPDGRRSYTVLEDEGLMEGFVSTGENLSCADYAETGTEVVDRWMASTMGHREAILHSSFTDAAIGIYYDGTMYYYCMLFAQLP